MMISPKDFRAKFENATLDEIIKGRDNLIREIRRYEKGNMSLDELSRDPSPEVVYMMNNLYLAEICHLIHENHQD